MKISLQPQISDIEWATRVAFCRPEGFFFGRVHRSQCRTRGLPLYLAREITKASYPAIGAFFGVHHTTVMLHHKTIAEELARDPGGPIAVDIEDIREILSTKLERETRRRSESTIINMSAEA